nr:hypothetical protein [Nostoc sp. DedSLP01]
MCDPVSRVRHGVVGVARYGDVWVRVVADPYTPASVAFAAAAVVFPVVAAVVAGVASAAGQFRCCQRR